MGLSFCPFISYHFHIDGIYNPMLVTEVKMKKKSGRPSKFNDDIERIALNLFEEGKTDKQVANIIGVTEQTINNWKIKHKSFFESLKQKKEFADQEVVRALFERATGYSHEEEKLLVVSDGGDRGSRVERVMTTKHYPPDPTSMIFWLKNRQPDLWREKQEVQQTGDSNIKITITEEDSAL